MYYIYMLRCAKYTFRHTAKKLERVFQTETRKDASKLEYHIKHLTKLQKEDIIKNAKKISYLKEKLDTKKYKVYKIK